MRTEEIFVQNGGVFHIRYMQFLQKLQEVRAFIFDWDGVFTEGTKTSGNKSSFSEADSMGLNLLRFAWHLKYGINPLCFIITGLHNETAIEFAKRERFNAVFLNFKSKHEALTFIENNYEVKASECAFFYDDILDLSICNEVALRFQIYRKSSPVFNRYVIKNKLADYTTAVSGGQHALRECAELCISAFDIYDKCVEERVAFSDTYQNFWDKRQDIKTEFFTAKDGKVERME